MVNGGDLCLLNNCFPVFLVSGVCSDIRSFNRILRRMLLTRFDWYYWFSSFVQCSSCKSGMMRTQEEEEKKKNFVFVTHNYTEYNQQWNLCSAFNPSNYTHTWSSGQPTLRRPGSSWRFGALLKGLNSVMENSCRNRDLNPQPRVTSPMLCPLGHDCPPKAVHSIFLIEKQPFFDWMCFAMTSRDASKPKIWGKSAAITKICEFLLRIFLMLR